MKKRIVSLYDYIVREWKDTIILLFLYGVLMIPFLFSVTHTIFSADDFQYATVIRDQLRINGNWFITVGKLAWTQWHNWSGRWMYFILPVGLNPLAIAEDNPFSLLKIEMVVAFFLFVASFIYLMTCILQDIFGIKGKKQSLLIAWIVLAVFLNTYAYSEVFYWFTGVNYSLMTAFELLGIAYGIRYFYRSGKYTIPFVLTGIWACDNLNALVPFWLFFLVFEYRRIISKSIRWRDVFLCLSFLISSALNVLAPGNFVRHDVIDKTGLHFFEAFLYALYGLTKTTLNILSLPIIEVFIALVIIIGLVLRRNGCSISVSFSKMCLYFAISIVGVAYPITLGYSSASFPNRVVFVICLHVVISFFVLSLILGNRVLGQVLYRDNFLDGKIWSIVIIVCALCFLSVPNWILKTPYYKAINYYYIDEKVYEHWKTIYADIKESPELKIVLDANKLGKSNTLKTPEISDDETYWTNVAISNYYGKESVIAIEE